MSAYSDSELVEGLVEFGDEEDEFDSDGLDSHTVLVQRIQEMSRGQFDNDTDPLVLYLF